MPIIRLIEIIKSAWNHGSDYFKLSEEHEGKRKLELHTGGDSGNESIIKAIKGNGFLVFGIMKCVKWEFGGHHYFEINLIET